MDQTTHALFNANGTWRTYTPTDGLVSLRIDHIAEDQAGQLWFATMTNGVSCFDGETFANFTEKDGLVSNAIICIEPDSHGNIWFGGHGGICRYDGRSFHQLDTSIWGDRCFIGYLACDRNGGLWIAGRSNRQDTPMIVAHYDGHTLRDLSHQYAVECGTADDRCWGIAPDDQGRVWFGVGRMVCYDGDRFHCFGEEQGLPASTWAVAQATTGGPLWVGGMGALGRFDGHTYEPIDVEINGYVRRIQSDHQGRIWVCTNRDGVLCYKGTQCQRFTYQDGLPYPFADAVQVDREGQIWFATWGGGVGRYDPLSIEKIGTDKHLPDAAVTTIGLDTQGRVWAGFGSIEGPDAEVLASWDGRVITLWNQETGLHSVDCMAIHHHRKTGDLWLGDWLGLVRYDGQTIMRLDSAQGFTGERVYSLAEDDEGVLYIGHGDADKMYITTYDGAQFCEVLHLDRMGQTYISAILNRGDGDLWFGVGGLGGQMASRGIGRYNSAQGLIFYDADAGLLDTRIEDLCAGQNNSIWIATVGGLSLFDGKEMQNFTTEHGLPNNHIQCLYMDEQSHLWIGSQAGVSRYDGHVFQTIYSEHISSTYEITADAQGRMWFATQDGLVGYSPQHIPPRVRIVQTIADQVYADKDAIELISSGQQVSFEYQGLSSRTHSQHMLYACRLRGYEEDWRRPTRELRAFYHDLPEGDYCFEVKAIDRDLNQSQPAQLQVKVIADPYTAGLAAALSTDAIGDFVGNSTALRHTQTQLAQVAPTRETVLILGETGTGKGLAARAVHSLSPRKDGPFIQVNCGAIPRDLIESELFGHERGAFTGAVSRKMGKIELARDGTLFLDEIGDMPLDAQVKLLQLLEEQTFMRVGGTETFPTKVRVVAATNRDLWQMATEELFREDLYFRLRVFEVQLPALRQRSEDIPLLAAYFAARMAAHLNKPIRALSASVEHLLSTYQWPGNVRELEHTIKRAVIVCPSDEIRAEDLALELGST
ncbi:MAG: ligand-binding sensor domain-containing protein, partial [Planctomycetota bacterium]